MSEAPKTYLIPEYLRFTDARIGKDPGCPMCGTRQWVYEVPSGAREASNPQPAPTYVMKSTALHFDGIPAIPAMALTCENCGFIRQHNLAWLEMKMAESTNE